MSEAIKGLNDLIKKFEKLKDLDFQKALMAGGYELMRYSMDNTPVITGNLQGSFSVEKNDKGGVDLVNSANYSHAVEFGHGTVPPKGMVRKAIDEHQNDILQAVKNELEKQIKEV